MLVIYVNQPTQRLEWTRFLVRRSIHYRERGWARITLCLTSYRGLCLVLQRSEGKYWSFESCTTIDWSIRWSNKFNSVGQHAEGRRIKTGKYSDWKSRTETTLHIYLYIYISFILTKLTSAKWASIGLFGQDSGGYAYLTSGNECENRFALPRNFSY